MTKEEKRERRRERRRQGICALCPTPTPFTLCDTHRQKKRNATLIRRIARRQQGKCRDCGKEAFGLSSCAHCTLLSEGGRVKDFKSLFPLDDLKYLLIPGSDRRRGGMRQRGSRGLAWALADRI